ncbi:tape measure protein [Rodentibacter caecimuris]|uniref:tape measure protein n=1 Tax=Rodentibacter caecimuris TaxID=1796644 RepID=UPI00211A16C4|nr:tape measure protein [Rodentibacter heylii]MCQ9124364.1 tape measure protein [Rodentibacter heylii]
MNVVRELVTKLRYQVDNSKLKAYVVQTQQAAKGIRGNLNNAINGLRQRLAGSAVEAKEVGKNLKEAKKNLLSLRNMVGGYFAMIAGGNVIKIADDWASVDSRVKLATKSAEEHKHALNQIFDLSQRSGQDYLASADLFSKVNRNAGDLGLSLDDTLNLTEIIGQTMTIGGGDQGAQQAALMQLGQALGSGALRGDELNSIIEQAPRLANAIADSFGVPIGQLKDMGKAGKLTSKELAQGLLKQADKIQKEFDQMPKTFGRGMTILKNKAGQLIDTAVNKVSKLGEMFYYAAEWVTKNIKLVGILATVAIGAKLLPMLKATNVNLKQIIVNGTRAAAPFLAIVGALTVVGLVLEDIYVWTQGGISITGGLVGRFDQWAAKFTVIGDMARLLWSNIKDIAAEFGTIIDFDFSLENWQEFSTGILQYIINGLGNLLELLLNVSRFVKRLIKGDFAGAFDIASDAVSGLSLKFLLFYSLALTAIGGVGSLLWALFSPLKLVGKLFYGLGYGITKAFKLGFAVIKPFISILKFTSKSIFAIGKAFVFASSMIIKAIWAIARAMLAAMMSNPILAAITIIIGLVLLLIIYWDDVKTIAIAVWDAISTKAAEIWESITTGASEMWENIKNKAAETWENVKKDAGEKWNGVTDIFKKAWNDSINTVVSWFDSLIPNWIKDLFSDGAKAEVKISGEALTTPVSAYAPPQRLSYGGRPVFAPNQNMNQTNNFNIQGSASPTSVANAVAGKLSRRSPNPYGVGQIEYAG